MNYYVWKDKRMNRSGRIIKSERTEKWMGKKGGRTAAILKV